MHSPSDGNEWVEVYFTGNSPYNISGLSLEDNYAKDEIICCNVTNDCSLNITNETYFLIFDQDTTINLTGKVAFCVDDNSIGNGLGNSGDRIAIREGNLTLTEMEYDFSASQGKSITLINGTYIESDPTPWGENIPDAEENISQNSSIGPKALNISFILPELMYSGAGYSVFKITNLNYPEQNQRVNFTFYYNVSMENQSENTLIFENTVNLSLVHYTTNVDDYVFGLSGKYTVCAEIIIAEGVDSAQTECRAELNPPMPKASRVF
jgi:hypothetical protein